MSNFSSFSDYKQHNGDLDLNGCLCAVEISFSSTEIASDKIYQKFCQEYPSIKPALDQKITEQRIEDPRLSLYRFKMKKGEYVWKNEDIIVTFSFLEIAGVTGPDPEQIDYINKVLTPHMPKKREVMIIDRKLYNRLVASKKAEDEKADKAKKDAADKAALDF